MEEKIYTLKYNKLSIIAFVFVLVGYIFDMLALVSGIHSMPYIPLVSDFLGLIFSIERSLFDIGLIFIISGFVFGIVSLSEIKKTGEKGKNLFMISIKLFLFTAVLYLLFGLYLFLLIPYSFLQDLR